MIIENAKYIKAPLGNPDNENTGIKATINGVESWVPMDEDNRHFAEIMRQVAAGELTIADAD
ncbi:MAG TPA: hypothetical protein DCW49_09690 [Alteromonas australica]|nr:hypothetical protein [Alteromonas australica]